MRQELLDWATKVILPGGELFVRAARFILPRGELFVRAAKVILPGGELFVRAAWVVWVATVCSIPVPPAGVVRRQGDT